MMAGYAAAIHREGVEVKDSTHGPGHTQRSGAAGAACINGSTRHSRQCMARHGLTARLGSPQQQAQRQEGCRAVRRREAHGGRGPCGQDDGQPAAGAQRHAGQVGWDLQEVPDEEEACGPGWGSTLREQRRTGSSMLAKSCQRAHPQPRPLAAAQPLDGAREEGQPLGAHAQRGIAQVGSVQLAAEGHQEQGRQHATAGEAAHRRPVHRRRRRPRSHLRLL